MLNNNLKKIIINTICVLVTIDAWLLNANYVLYAVCIAFVLQFVLEKIYIIKE